MLTTQPAQHWCLRPACLPLDADPVLCAGCPGQRLVDAIDGLPAFVGRVFDQEAAATGLGGYIEEEEMSNVDRRWARVVQAQLDAEDARRAAMCEPAPRHINWRNTALATVLLGVLALTLCRWLMGV